jgi:hypothetical protein
MGGLADRRAVSRLLGEIHSAGAWVMIGLLVLHVAAALRHQFIMRDGSLMRTRDVALPQSDWFNVKEFPEATFEASGFRAAGDGRYEAVGTLTIRGIRKDVVLPFKLDAQASSAHAVGQVEIVRTDFGIGQGEWGTGAVVGLGVTVTVDLVATR